MGCFIKHEGKVRKVAERYGRTGITGCLAALVKGFPWQKEIWWDICESYGDTKVWTDRTATARKREAKMTLTTLEAIRGGAKFRTVRRRWENGRTEDKHRKN